MVNSATDALLQGLFPAYCALCDLPSHRDLPLCRACEAELPRNDHGCHCCALPLPPTEQPQLRLCGGCLNHAPPFQRVRSPWLYSEQMAYLIQRWKFGRQTRLTPLLAALWLKGLQHVPDIDLLIPVPLHWRRLWRRGFNQSALLCRQLRKQSPQIAAMDADLGGARRCRATAAQSGMNAARRAVNLHGAFTVQRPCDNLRVAIVDDVLTTGATAAALAAALADAGASHIEIWCLARTPAPG